VSANIRIGAAIRRRVTDVAGDVIGNRQPQLQQLNELRDAQCGHEQQQARLGEQSAQDEFSGNAENDTRCKSERHRN